MCNVLLGGAVGDALGMPFESMILNNQQLVDWDGKTYLPCEYHELQAGQFTDDTQFSLAVAKSLIENNGFNPDDLSKKYVELFNSKTIRGYGKTTLQAVQNLMNGTHWSESGVPGSYGNGTAMRAAPFGVYFRNDLKLLIESVKIDSAMTHASDEAEAGALAIAIASFYAVNKDMTDLLKKITVNLPDTKVKTILCGLSAMINSNNITPQQALRALGTKADVKQTVPTVLYCLLRFPTYEEAVLAAIKSGGDTDTNASLIGGLFAANHGKKCIPQLWVDGVEDKDNLIILDSQLYTRNNSTYF